MSPTLHLHTSAIRGSTYLFHILVALSYHPTEQLPRPHTASFKQALQYNDVTTVRLAAVNGIS